jgi:hypothetical protein
VAKHEHLFFRLLQVWHFGSFEKQYRNVHSEVAVSGNPTAPKRHVETQQYRLKGGK